MSSKKYDSISAVLFAAGNAGALRPVTEFFPKCMLPLGKKTIIQRILEGFDTQAIDNFIVVVGRLGDMVQHHLEILKRASIVKSEINILQMDESLKNTGGVLKKYADHLPSRFFVCYADVWIPELDPSAVIEQHISMLESRPSLISTLVCSTEYNMGVGVAEAADEEHLLRSFIEKPSNSTSLINTATCVMEKRIIDYVDDAKDGLFSELIPKAIAANESVGYSLCGEWFHIQTLADLYVYNMKQRKKESSPGN